MTIKQDFGLDYRRWDLFIQTVNFHLDRISRYIATAYLDPQREVWTVVAEMSSFMALVGPYVADSKNEVGAKKANLKQRLRKENRKRNTLTKDFDLVPMHELVTYIKSIVYETEFIRDMQSKSPKKKNEIWAILNILEFLLFEISGRMIENEFIPKPKSKSKDPANALGGEY